MLGDVEHAHVGGGRLGGDDELVLRHVPRAVNLPVMVDFHRHLHLAKASQPTEAEDLRTKDALRRLQQQSYMSGDAFISQSS